MARTVALTRGARGAPLIAETECVEIPAAPAREVDPTGAGDVFGVVLTLELAHGKPLAVAGRAAAAAAAASSRGRVWGRCRAPIVESAAGPRRRLAFRFPCLPLSLNRPVRSPVWLWRQA